MMDPTSLLFQRVDLLENVYIGKSGNLSSKKSRVCPLLDRVLIVSNKIEGLGDEIPALKSIYEQATKLKPLIQQKRMSVAQVLLRVDTLLAQRHILEQQFKQVKKIDDYSQFINCDMFKDGDELAIRLESLNTTLQSLLVMSKQQTQEIDELLNVYENTMTVLADVCSSWEATMNK